jgi:hypothetical protein
MGSCSETDGEELVGGLECAMEIEDTVRHIMYV